LGGGGVVMARPLAFSAISKGTLFAGSVEDTCLPSEAVIVFQGSGQKAPSTVLTYL
jgi:hypothetical protein